MEIRHERPEDAATIRALTDAAFIGMPFSDQTEGLLVDALRAAGGMTLSLVAARDGEILGHISFSAIRIDGQETDWHQLSPVSVWPALQRAGIGQALIRDGLARLMSAGAGGCVLLGDPRYYRRFGFESVPDLYYPHAPAWAFQQLTLRGPRPSGEVSFHPVFQLPSE